MSPEQVLPLCIAVIAVVAVIAPWVRQFAGAFAGPILAAVPLSFAVFFATQIGTIASGQSLRFAVDWIPQLDIAFSLHLDGLALLFCLLVTGLGGLILLYAGSYLKEDKLQGRFYAYFLGFMVSMVGLVLADNLILVFIFWELTSITSYLLIGYEHEKPKARKSALQALVVTGLGGLAMLAGLILLGLIARELGAAQPWELSGVIEVAHAIGRGELAAHPLFVPAVILILAGAFTKSAQFPFHFWLPNAMAAPSPVSAFLHSSTMVKAGVYLVARLNPALGGSAVWTWALIAFGATTMCVGAYLATRKTLYKPVLAYSTVSSLGILVMCVGLVNAGDIVPQGGPKGHEETALVETATDAGHEMVPVAFAQDGTHAEEAGEHHDDAHAGGHEADHAGGHGEHKDLGFNDYAAMAFAGYLLAHALFKCCLFLIAGIVDHGAHEKDTEKTGGLIAKMPVSAICAVVTALSLAGIPLTLGFVGKEFILNSALTDAARGGMFGITVLIATGFAATLTVMIAWLVSVRVFFSPPMEEDRERMDHAHGGDWQQLTGPVLLACATVIGALVPMLFAAPLVASVAASVSGSPALLEPGAVRMDLLHVLHPSWAMAVSAIAVVVGTLLHFGRSIWRTITRPFDVLFKIGPERTYFGLFGGTMWIADFQTRLLQSGYLRAYIIIIMSALVGLAGWSILRGHLYDLADFDLSTVSALEAFLVAIILVTTPLTTMLRSRLATIAVLGAVGYSVAVLFVLFGAPDISMTQFSIETLTVVIFVLVLYHLPRFSNYSPGWVRGIDVALAVLFGVVMGTLVLVAAGFDAIDPISWYYNEHAVGSAKGHNIINVILVDFRGADTMGEITVLGLAAIGVWTLLRVRAPRPEVASHASPVSPDHAHEHAGEHAGEQAGEHMGGGAS